MLLYEPGEDVVAGTCSQVLNVCSHMVVIVLCLTGVPENT